MVYSWLSSSLDSITKTPSWSSLTIVSKDGGYFFTTSISNLKILMQRILLLFSEWFLLLLYHDSLTFNLSFISDLVLAFFLALCNGWNFKLLLLVLNIWSLRGSSGFLAVCRFLTNLRNRTTFTTITGIFQDFTQMRSLQLSKELSGDELLRD